MKRKHNPLVALVALLLMAVLLLCAGCSEGTAAEEPESPPRFTVEIQEDSSGFESIKIITDNETGAQYLWTKSGYGAGLTVLQPAPEEANT